MQILTGNIDKEQFGSIFQATLGRFFLKFKNGIVALFDVNTRKILKETTEITEMKFVVWNYNLTYAALVGQNNIFIINKNMEILAKIREMVIEMRRKTYLPTNLYLKNKKDKENDEILNF